MSRAERTKRRLTRRRLGGAVLVSVLALIAMALGLLTRPGAGRLDTLVPTVQVQRGGLLVTIGQRGALWAMKPYEVKCEVEGSATILQIVDEGTLLTEQDVAEGKVIVQLDSSGLEEREADRQISFYDAEAAHTEAQEDYEIQLKQNESNIAIAELNVKFARMELERYLGADLGARVLEGGAHFAALAEETALGGLARQALRDLESQVQLAGEELTRAEDTLQWTQKLYEKGFVNRNELAADHLAVTRRRIKVEAANEELRLLKRYTLPKEAEQRYSDVTESQRDLERVKARAESELAQAEAELKSARASYELEKERLAKTRDMIAKCTIRAPQPGRIIYGGATNPWERRRQSIEQGATVQQNQTIVRIPDLSTLAARMSIPEQDIDKVKLGQPAVITLEASPGEVLTGRVARVSPVASAEHAWLNPDSKVYEIDVALDEMPQVFIPGMSASAQVVVAYVQDVIRVPTSAVKRYKGRSFCWVLGPTGPRVREVETGHASERHAEIRSGLNVGEEVFLAPPTQADESELEEKVRAAEEAAKRAAGEGAELPGAPGPAGPAAEGPAGGEGPGGQRRGMSPQSNPQGPQG